MLGLELEGNLIREKGGPYTESHSIHTKPPTLPEASFSSIPFNLPHSFLFTFNGKIPFIQFYKFSVFHSTTKAKANYILPTLENRNPIKLRNIREINRAAHPP